MGINPGENTSAEPEIRTLVDSVHTCNMPTELELILEMFNMLY
jgi:hypothetical protein